MYFLSIGFPILLLVYLVIIDTIPMYPFNDLKQLNHIELILGRLLRYPPLLLLIFCAFFHQEIMTFICVATSVSIFVFHFAEWWVPYFFEFDNGRIQQIYREKYGNTYRFLKDINGRLAPDLQHIIITVILAVQMVCQVILLVQVYH